MRKVTCTFVSGLIGLFLLIIGLGFLWFGTRSLIRMWAWEKLTLKNGSEAMQRWMNPPQPVIFKVYMFNVTNPDEVAEGALPVFTEMGPYVYEEIREKINVTERENFTLSYKIKNYIKFKRRLSGGLKQSDKVTILNVPLAGAILSVYEAVPEFVGLFDDIWNYFFPGQKNIFITTTVREILFDGMTIDCSSKITEVYIACRAMESRNTYSVRKDGKKYKFSFFYAKNGTSTETYQVNQGILDLKTIAQLAGMNNSTLVSTWNNYYCDMINGSDGAQFPIKLNRSEKLYIFEKDLCRSIFIEYEKELTQNGVKLYKYVNTRKLLASAVKMADNACFCRSRFSLRHLVQDPDIGTEKESDIPKVCFHDGVLPLMPCVGAPIVASFPHFYLGDEKYLNFSGLKPVKELHETYIEIEPNSGITVKGLKRLQFNVEMRRISDAQLTSQLPEGLFPVLWIEEGTELSSELFKLLRYTLIEKQILEWSTIVLIGLGAFLIIQAYLIQSTVDKSFCCGRKNILEGSDSQLMMLNNQNVYAQKVKGPIAIWEPPKVDTLGDKRAIEDINEFSKKHSMINNFMN